MFEQIYTLSKLDLRPRLIKHNAKSEFFFLRISRSVTEQLHCSALTGGDRSIPANSVQDSRCGHQLRGLFAIQHRPLESVGIGFRQIIGANFSIRKAITTENVAEQRNVVSQLEFQSNYAFFKQKVLRRTPRITYFSKAPCIKRWASLRSFPWVMS